MEWGSATLAFYGVGAAALATSLVALRRRLQLSKAKHPSLTGHSRMARRGASFVPFYEYGEAEFFHTDDAPEEGAARRRAGLIRLAALYRQRFAQTLQRTAQGAETLPHPPRTHAYQAALHSK